MKPRKLLERLRAGAMENIAFDDAVSLIEALDFRLQRVTGSHRLYFHSRADRPLNMQPIGGCAKAYQLRQLLKLIDELDLRLRA